MRYGFSAIAAAGALLGATLGSVGSYAQKSGGILRMPDFASPASMSIHEEATRAAVTPLMGVFNNLVLFDQHVPQNSLASVVPDLAIDWSWDEANTALTFRLHTGVRWHDGKPFTARDVKCTWDTLAGKSNEKFRLNPRKSWYRNLEEITTNGDDEVTFHLKRPQPYLLALLASGVSPVYPCHVTPAQMRQHPIGTGPFKFVEFKPNELIRVTKNQDYWKPGRPYLDGMEFPIVPSVATRALMFVAGTVDMTLSYGVSMPRPEKPSAGCDLRNRYR
jgi:peptide/nickel transport system substrate-binding protein